MGVKEYYIWYDGMSLRPITGMNVYLRLKSIYEHPATKGPTLPKEWGWRRKVPLMWKFLMKYRLGAVTGNLQVLKTRNPQKDENWRAYCGKRKKLKLKVR